LYIPLKILFTAVHSKSLLRATSSSAAHFSQEVIEFEMAMVMVMVMVMVLMYFYRIYVLSKTHKTETQSAQVGQRS